MHRTREVATGVIFHGYHPRVGRTEFDKEGGGGFGLHESVAVFRAQVILNLGYVERCY